LTFPAASNLLRTSRGVPRLPGEMAPLFHLFPVPYALCSMSPSSDRAVTFSVRRFSATGPRRRRRRHGPPRAHLTSGIDSPLLPLPPGLLHGAVHAKVCTFSSSSSPPPSSTPGQPSSPSPAPSPTFPPRLRPTQGEQQQQHPSSSSLHECMTPDGRCERRSNGNENEECTVFGCFTVLFSDEDTRRTRPCQHEFLVPLDAQRHPLSPGL
jgi:hypothetical protein